jgi:hypothetical protein
VIEVSRLLPLLLAVAALAAPLPAAAQKRDNDVAHSPWLALRLEQGGAEVPIKRADLLRSEVTLKRAPFTILLPVRGDKDAYLIAAWRDDSIFTAAEPEKRAGPEAPRDAPAFFGPYTAMADTAAGSGALMMRPDSHNYLEGLKLGPDRCRHTFNVTMLAGEDDAGQWRETPMRAAKGPVFLVAWFDEDGDGIMRHGEFEFLVLNFR